ncbi:hypothetical protein [Spirosoma koreense]
MRTSTKKITQPDKQAISYKPALANWCQAVMDFASLNDKIEVLLRQSDCLPMQSPKRKTELLRLKSDLARILAGLIHQLQSDIDCIGPASLREHSQLLNQEFRKLEAQVTKLASELPAC